MTSELALPDNLARSATDPPGPQGAARLERRPEIAAGCARRWSLTLDPPFPQISINDAAPGECTDGAHGVRVVCILENI